MSDYEVGYGKPPKSGQIRKGEVRNPNGRGGNKAVKKPATSELALLEQIDGEVVVIDGRVMTRREATIRAQYLSALKGKAPAIRYIERLGKRLGTETSGGGVLQLPCDDPDNWNGADAIAQHTARMEKARRNERRRKRRAKNRPRQDTPPVLKPHWQVLADLENETVVKEGTTMAMRELRLRAYTAHAASGNRAAQDALANIQDPPKPGEIREAGYLLVPPPMSLEDWSRMADKQQAKYRQQPEPEE